ncbi:helix-turn-helix transcriptional regulator [Roseomonas sp. 18066]|uniref:helix-turn-helix domain-containing protein n=1 Tax=Roseomonas sp. 18066 TaxID=2681412 RepID=UPI001F387453|nr:helix-turn-helix transcriptional regulator [Roseomonas sp. 18066]
MAGLEQKDLSETSGVSINTIRNMEARAAEPVRGRLDTMERVVEALARAGVEFIPENGGGAGVRLRRPSLPGSEIAHPGFAATMGNALRTMPGKQEVQVSEAAAKDEARRNHENSED